MHPLPDVWILADQSGDFQVEQRRVCQLDHFGHSHDGVAVSVHVFPETLEGSRNVRSRPGLSPAPGAAGFWLSPFLTGNLPLPLTPQIYSESSGTGRGLG